MSLEIAIIFSTAFIAIIYAHFIYITTHENGFKKALQRETNNSNDKSLNNNGSSSQVTHDNTQNSQTNKNLTDGNDQKSPAITIEQEQMTPRPTSEAKSKFSDLSKDNLLSRIQSLESILSQRDNEIKQLTKQIAGSVSTESDSQHGSLYSTIAKHNKPDLHTKSVHITMHTGPHDPIICATLNNFPNIVTAAILHTEQKISLSTMTTTISVLCCNEHAITLRKLLPNHTIGFITTDNMTAKTSSTLQKSHTEFAQTNSPSSTRTLTTTMTLADLMSHPLADEAKNQTAQQSAIAQTKPKVSSQSSYTSDDIVLTKSFESKPPVQNLNKTSAPPDSKVTTKTDSKRIEPVSSGKKSDDNTSITSWSDEMNELSELGATLPPLTTHNPGQMNAQFYIECMILTLRSLSAKQPRSTLRGILDRTRPITSIQGFDIMFGKGKITVNELAKHRHSYNHTARMKDSTSPYLNIDKPHCTIDNCPFNIWIIFPNQKEEIQRDSAISNLPQVFQNLALSTNVTPQDVAFCIRLAGMMKAFDTKLLYNVKLVCDMIYTQGSQAAT